MFGSTVIDVAIGMIFVYLLLSLLCSAINEYIELKLNYRAKNLWKGVQLLLNGTIDEGKQKPDMATTSPPQGVDLASELYQHGLVRALFRDEHNLPSYIPSRTFALALWNLASQKAQEMSPSSPLDPAEVATTNLRKIKEIVSQLPNRELAQSLSTLIDEADGDFNRAVKNVEDWFDGAMDRASGWYKRRVQKILLVIGFVTAIFINADSVNIGKALIRDKALRDVVVASATKYYDEKKSDSDASPEPTPPPAAGGANAANTNAANTNAASTGDANSNSANANADAAAARTRAANTNARGASPDNTNANTGGSGDAATPTPSPTATPTPVSPVEKARRDLDDLGLPLGWAFDKSIYAQDPKSGVKQDQMRGVPQGWREWCSLSTAGWLTLKIFGLLLTGLAISQGAPFWFDLLNKFMVIRSTVKPKEKSGDEGQKDKPATRKPKSAEPGDDTGTT